MCCDWPRGARAAWARAMRAHANCVENLPVYGAIALTAFAAHVTGTTMDALAQVFMGARIGQTLVHVILVETNATIFARFSFFLMQVVAMLWMATEVVLHAAAQ